LGGCISGHATEQLQQHHSTAALTEMLDRIAKIISLAGVREAMGSGSVEVVPIGSLNENGQLGTASRLADSA
jgi:hypothetical protein